MQHAKSIVILGLEAVLLFILFYYLVLFDTFHDRLCPI